MAIFIIVTLYGTHRFFLPLLANNPERSDIDFGLTRASGAKKRRSSRRHHRKKSSRKHH